MMSDAQGHLHFDDLLRGQEMWQPSICDRKATPSSLILRRRTEAEHLETATVGEHRPVPVHEAVQPSGFGNKVVTGPQEKMIGVAEDDPCSHVGQFRGEALTDAWVPTGMKTGVSMAPLVVCKRPSLAAEPALFFSS